MYGIGTNRIPRTILHIVADLMEEPLITSFDTIGNVGIMDTT